MPRTTTRTIDPVTRIEGHLKIKIEVTDDTVSNAWSSGLLWRGFEPILQGRAPSDAPVLTQRICGVCHAVHRLTSIMALEDSVGITPPPDAVRIRNIEQAANFIYSHAAHLFMLTGPDYDLYGLVPGLSQGLNQDAYNAILKSVVLPAQRLCHEIGALFGGKTPHHMTTVPGGATCVPTAAARDAALAKLDEIRNLVGPYLPAVHGYLDANQSGLERLGRATNNFLAYGVFCDPYVPKDAHSLLLRRGAFINGSLRDLDVSLITEGVLHSWYTAKSGGTPWSESVPQPDYGKAGAYSWIKSPRYADQVCEVGPLARMVVAGLHRPNSSVYDRLKARLEETEWLIGHLERWIRELSPGSPVYLPYTDPDTGMGIGLWEAPRGANGHWMKITGGIISHYQVVSPTNWNASPRDDSGRPGPMEHSLIGAPAAETSGSGAPLKVVRSFDPCLACSIH